MEKIYELTKYGGTHRIVLRKANYSNNGTLAIFMIELVNDDGCEYEENWACLTVNIGDSNLFANDTHAFLDTNNLGFDIINWLKSNKIATLTGDIGFSGYCRYPLAKFSSKVLAGMKAY